MAEKYSEFKDDVQVEVPDPPQTTNSLTNPAMRRLNILQILYGALIMVFGLIACIFTNYEGMTGGVVSVVFSSLVIASAVLSIKSSSDQTLSSNKAMLQVVTVLACVIACVVSAVLNLRTRAYPDFIFVVIAILSFIYPLFAVYRCLIAFWSSKPWLNEEVIQLIKKVSSDTN